jgi:anti-sigma B factor antagonist
VPSLSLSEQTDEDVYVLELAGELDVSTVGSVQREVIAAVETHPCLVLDGMGLTFIDSSGMRLLLSALRIVGRRKGCFVFACANPTVLRLFAVTGMDQTFDLASSRKEALDVARTKYGAGSGGDDDVA